MTNAWQDWLSSSAVERLVAFMVTVRWRQWYKQRQWRLLVILFNTCTLRMAYKTQYFTRLLYTTSPSTVSCKKCRAQQFAKSIEWTQKSNESVMRNYKRQAILKEKAFVIQYKNMNLFSGNCWYSFRMWFVDLLICWSRRQFMKCYTFDRYWFSIKRPEEDGGAMARWQWVGNEWRQSSSCRHFRANDCPRNVPHLISYLFRAFNRNERSTI